MIFEDNQGAIVIARNPVSHSRTKHIDIKYHYMRETVQNGLVELKYCPTKEMAADILSKPLCRGKFKLFHKKMDIESIQPHTYVGVLRNVIIRLLITLEHSRHTCIHSHIKPFISCTLAI